MALITETCGLCGLDHATEQCIYWPTNKAKDARAATKDTKAPKEARRHD